MTAALDFSYFDQVHGNLPVQAIQDAMGRYLRSWPGETESSEIPPGFVRGKLDLLDYESVLGIYDVETRRITIWTQGIDAVAERLGIAPLLLQRIVRLHESAHAVHHLGYDRASSGNRDRMVLEEARSDAVFGNLGDAGREQIAQLATCLALRLQRSVAVHPRAAADVDAMLGAVEKMIAMQSTVYRLPAIVMSMDVERLSTKLGLVLGLVDAGLQPTPEHVEGILL